ncbi:hypothetical protein [Streptomyces sp. NBC_01006]|uniref:hypothetical protein n=1 Tax=Streptomyces sp. NBC_01006 TaxID=2903716 RepID=UPI00386D59B8
MTNDVDTLATALYATTDDILKEHPGLAPWRPPVGNTPRLSDAELVTLATMQAILGFTSEAKRLRHARAHLRHLFPYLPQQPGHKQRLRKAASLMRSVRVGSGRLSVRSSASHSDKQSGLPAHVRDKILSTEWYIGHDLVPATCGLRELTA